MSGGDPLADDVEAFCKRSLPMVGRLVVLTVAGPRRDALPDADAARGLADALVGELRAASRRARRLHLFQAAPVPGLSLLRGHAWNRIAETQLYDDPNSPTGYTPTFRLVA